MKNVFNIPALLPYTAKEFNPICIPPNNDEKVK